MPYDQFTVEQLAGDLLPNATLAQKIATGFNRNHRTNGEGGIIPEEYRVEYVADRAQTTATVWMGLTLGCARCHDHKYDPFLQKDFYRLFAYFNNIPNEKGFSYNYGNEEPYIKAPLPEQKKQLAALDQKIVSAEAHYAGLHTRLEKEQAIGNTICPLPSRTGPSPKVCNSVAPPTCPLSMASIPWIHLAIRRSPTSVISIRSRSASRSIQTRPMAASSPARRIISKGWAKAST